MNQRMTVAVLIVLALPLSIFAQRSKPAPQTDNADDLWRTRAQTLTDDVLKDASNLNSLRRALVWSKLAERWWLQDQRRAKTWIANAIEVVEQVPNRESPQEREQRISAAKYLLYVSSRLDQKQSQRLINLVSEVDKSTSDLDRDGTANSLVHAAIGIADRDTKRATELGMQALRIGVPSDIADLLFALRARDVKLADSLFLEALSVARQNESASLLDALSYAAFPMRKGVPGPIPEPPDNLKAELLGLYAAFLNAHVDEMAKGTWFCSGVQVFIVPILPEFDRLLPQQAPVVKQTIQKCQSNFPTVRDPLEDAGGSNPVPTVDALLKAAEETDVAGVRAHYQYRAAQLAKDQGDYERAIKILDSMNDESRQLMQGSWDAYHWDWAASAAVNHFQHGRLVEMNLVLNGVPSKLQPFAKMAFLDRLPVTKLPEDTPTIQFLTDAATGLRKSDISESEKYSWYFGLLKLTMRYQRSDAIPVFKEAIASLNRATTDDANFLNTNQFADFLPASLLEINEFAVRETLASVTNLEARTLLRLQLLRAVLNQAR
jgi:hypothetical protein